MEACGILHKMSVQLNNPIKYYMRLDQNIYLNKLLGQNIQIKFTHNRYCIYCQRKVSKLFQQGYCFPCTQKLAACDFCIVKPEKCHFHLGTCREPEWGLQNCMQSHIVYLANTSNLKVGITRKIKIPARWIDQGAVQALPVLEVKQRYHAGLVEQYLSKKLLDKTNWKRMLLNNVENIDLNMHREAILLEINNIIKKHDSLQKNSLNILDGNIFYMVYPYSQHYKNEIHSIKLDKINVIEDRLMGIKGQYLIFKRGVLNIRRHAGYEIHIKTI